MMLDPLASITPYAALKQEENLQSLCRPLAPTATRFLSYKGLIPAGDGKKILSFDLITQNLEQNFRPYSALSYTWGHPVLDDYEDGFDHAIQCNGQTIPIGLNLSDALQYLFLESQNAPELLWVDAICINQSNTQERNQQVQMMTMIYARTSTVIVWLGNDDADARTAHEFFKEYIPVLQQIFQDFFEVDPLREIPAEEFNLYNDSALHEKYGISQRSAENWSSVIKFFSRRWFQRIWVMQETLFAPKSIIYCGSLRFDWQELDLFVALVFGAKWHGPLSYEMRTQMSDIAGLFTLYREIGQVAGAGNFPDPTGLMTSEDKAYAFAQFCLIRTTIFRATDPRDKVYAISAFVFSYMRRLGVKIIWPRADYTLTVEDLFKMTLGILAWKTKSLDLLSYVADESDREVSTLCTWMPHLQNQDQSRADKGCLFGLRGITMFHAGSLSKDLPTPSEVKIESTTWALKVTGCVVDTIVEVARFGDDNDVVSLLKTCLGLPATYLTGEPPVEVLWRTIIANQTANAYVAPPEQGQAFSRFLEGLLISRGLKFVRTGDNDSLLEILSVLEKIATKCPHSTVPTPEEFSKLLPSAIQKLRKGPDAVDEMLGTRTTFQTMITPTPWGLKGKSLCRTKSGYLGLFPYSAEAGDEAWLFKGARVFHLLRKLDDGESHKLMGEAYIHGLMEGQALKNPDLTWKTAVIR